MSAVEKAIGDSLALLNVVRQDLGFEPLADLPRAKPGNSSECVYARALSDVGVLSVSGGGEMTLASERLAQHYAKLWGTTAEGTRVQSPPQFAKVIGPFDGHTLPQYHDNN